MRWAREHAWESIEVQIHHDIPALYENIGKAGRRFWEKPGFRVVQIDIDPLLNPEGETARKAREQAVVQGLNPEVRSRYTMRLELT